MKREILFRGLSNQGKGWLYGDLIRNKREAIAIVPPHPLKVTHRYSCYEVIPDTIGQYTGLKDKGGNKIFEGDIVLIGEKLKAKVVYYDGAFRMQSEFSPTPTDTTDMGYMMREFSVRVIGNIHNNPELIK
jgi:hypothetical protein